MEQTEKRIVFVEKNRAELLDYTPAPMGPKDVLVRLAVSTVSSGTERANLTGDPFVSIRSTEPNVTFPRHGGYSSAGVVEQVGGQVTLCRPGDRVALSWSTHASLVRVPEANVYRLDDEISFSAGALVHIGTFPMAAVRKTRLELGESALVMGLGVLGLTAVQLLRAAGAVPVLAVDPNPQRRQRALEMGADAVFDPASPDFCVAVKEATGGGAKVAIEVTGNGHALDQALDCMAPFGRIALLGCTRHSDFSIDYYHKVHGPGITLVGAHTDARPKAESHPGYWTQRDDALALLALQKGGRIALERLVEDTHTPDEAPEVYARLAASPSFPVTQFLWQKQ